MTRVWCGPAALAYVTGKSVDEVHKAIRAHRREDGFGSGNRKGLGVIGWMRLEEMPYVLARLGFRSLVDRPEPRRTLAAFLREISFNNIVVLSGRHFIAVQNGTWRDQRHATPQKFANVPKPRSRVWGFLRII